MLETRTQKLERLADKLLGLNKLECYNYSILLCLKLSLDCFGPAAYDVQSPSVPGTSLADGLMAKKMAFNIKLEKFGADTKIKVIKEVRAFTDLGLKEAKD